MRTSGGQEHLQLLVLTGGPVRTWLYPREASYGGGKGSVVLLSMQGRRSRGRLQARGDGGLQRGRKMSSLAQLHFRDQGNFMSSGAKDHQKAGGNQEGTRNTRLLLSSGSTFIEGRHR